MTRRQDLPVRDLVLAILFALTAALVPAALALAPRPADPVTVLVPPWAAAGEAARVVAAADGALVATARAGRIAIARSADEDFVSRLYRAGALVVIDARAVSACFGFGRTRSNANARAAT
jgi:hypothetical protein